MKTKLYSAIAIASLVLSSCGGGQSDEDSAKQLEQLKKDSTEKANKKAQASVPVEMTWEELQKLDPKEIEDASFDNARKTVIIEGYLSMPGSIYTSGNSIRCHLYPRDGQSKGFYVNLEFQQGKTANHMEKMPTKYTLDDFKVHTDNNEVVGQNGYVKITGELSRIDGEYATLYIKKVEKAEPKPFDYAAAATQLTDANIKDMDGKLVYVDGTLDVPMFVYITETMALDLEGSGLKSKFSTYVTVGDGPNQISNLPSGWSQKDVKIHDNTGAVIKGKTRVYGMFSKPLTSIGDNKGTIYVERIGK
jgi:hypothetical protein